MSKNKNCSKPHYVPVLISFIFTLLFGLKAEIILPTLISDNMVLQQKQTVTIWGRSTIKDETLKVNGSWCKDSVTVTVKNYCWKTQLRTPGFGGPYTICIRGHETKRINNVMIGEVWLAGGQSNMEMPVDSTGKGFRGVINFREKIAGANYPGIRMFTVPKVTSTSLKDSCGGSWVVCSPQIVGKFSAAGYFFAKALYDSLNVPIGILHASWGGTNAETWVRKEVLTENCKFSKPGLAKDAGTRYNAMIYPVQNYTIKGVIWYQGESNKIRAAEYRDLMETLITSWRKEWKADFPFYFTQIVPFIVSGKNTELLREAQLKTLSVPKTGMVVTSDFSDLNHIHPRQKEEVGRRLALWALAKDYGKKINCSGPLYKSMSIQGNKIIIHFDYAESGLKTKGNNELKYFQIAGKDHNYIPAVAVIKGNTVEVFNEQISDPVAVRLAFTDKEIGNLFNNAGLPASIFRTDTIENNDSILISK